MCTNPLQWEGRAPTRGLTKAPRWFPVLTAEIGHISSRFLGRPCPAGAIQVPHTRNRGAWGQFHASVSAVAHSPETAIGCLGPERHQSYRVGDGGAACRRLREGPAVQRGGGGLKAPLSLPGALSERSVISPVSWCLVCTWCPPAPAPGKRRFFKLRQMWQSAGSAGVSFFLIMSLVWTDLRKWDYVFPLCSFIQLFVYLFAHLEVGCHRELARFLSCFHTHFISVPEDLRPQRETSQISSQKA